MFHVWCRYLFSIASKTIYTIDSFDPFNIFELIDFLSDNASLALPRRSAGGVAVTSPHYTLNVSSLRIPAFGMHLLSTHHKLATHVESLVQHFRQRHCFDGSRH